MKLAVKIPRHQTVSGEVIYIRPSEAMVLPSYRQTSYFKLSELFPFKHKIGIQTAQGCSGIDALWPMRCSWCPPIKHSSSSQPPKHPSLICTWSPHRPTHSGAADCILNCDPSKNQSNFGCHGLLEGMIVFSCLFIIINILWNFFSSVDLGCRSAPNIQDVVN